VALLQKTRGEEQWKVIQDNFNVNQMATYFAVNMVLSHWDGFFNNYFTYHDIHGTKKWEIFPWDQDKTWGFYDGIGRDEVFYNMPLNYGSAGAQTPNGGHGFAAGGLQWWRDGGYFSSPLLANPQFRKVFLAKTKSILEKVYTKEVYFPLLDQLAAKLKDDVILRDGPGGTAELAHNIASLKTHLEKRREFLLKQAELQGAK
jgi:spore coat protein CotH